MSATKEFILSAPDELSQEQKRRVALAAAQRERLTPDALLSAAWCLGPKTFVSALNLLDGCRNEPSVSWDDRPTRERNRAQWLARQLVQQGVFDEQTPDEPGDEDAPF
jgi:hypothetical protein